MITATKSKKKTRLWLSGLVLLCLGLSGCTAEGTESMQFETCEADPKQLLDDLKHAIAVTSEEIEENRRQLRRLEEYADFTQHLRQRRRSFLESVSEGWKGPAADRFIDETTEKDERHARQATEEIQWQHERLQQEKQALGNKYDDLKKKYRHVQRQ